MFCDLGHVCVVVCQILFFYDSADFFFVTKQTIEMKINKNNHKINEENVNHNRFRGVEGEVMILRVFSHD